jgi:hypothetical protein
MTISFRPLSENDVNYSNVFDLYEKAFSDVQRLPPWVLRYRMRNGKAGFNIIYENELWIGFIYSVEYMDIMFVQFFAISELCRSCGYGGKVMDSMKELHSGKRIALNIEELNAKAENYQQRIRRKAFYEKNAFKSSGYIVKEPAQRLEMLVRGGVITKEEIEKMYKYFMGNILFFIFGPKVIKIK